MGSAQILALSMVFAFAGASFFYSLAETALFSLSKWQVKQLAEKNPAVGGIVARLLNRPHDLLAAMVLGNTFAVAAMLAVALWMAIYRQWPAVITIIALFLISLVYGEVLPKTMAVRNPDVWALRIARPMSLLLSASLPLCRIAQAINQALIKVLVPRTIQPNIILTDADYQELIEMACQQGTLERSEKEIILQIISLDRRTAGEVMLPRSRMPSISDDLSIEDMMAAARKFKRRHLPIYDESSDTIVGVLNTRALLLDPQIDLADAVELPSFVPETTNLLQLLISLQRQRRGLAMVLDEFGGTAGMVTLEDILEEVVGRIRPEVESERFLLNKIGPGKWRISGAMRVDDFRREYPQIGDVPDVETMGGLLLKLLDVVPAPGEFASFKGLRLTAQVADERRVRELLVEVERTAPGTVANQGGKPV